MIVADGGGAVRAAREVQMTIDEVRDIANRTLAALRDDADSARGEFRAMALPAGAFGQVPRGLALERQHQAAHDVFVDTIHGVVRDLEDFKARLLASAEGQENTDQAAQAALAAVGRAIESRRHASAVSYDRSRSEHRSDLEVPGEQSPEQASTERDATDAAGPSAGDVPGGAPGGASGNGQPAGGWS